MFVRLKARKMSPDDAMLQIIEEAARSGLSFYGIRRLSALSGRTRRDGRRLSADLLSAP